MEFNGFARQILNWYHSEKRDLPWRKTQNAYEIWLSEIILQQTRVSQGLPYFEKFREEFEDVFALARADEDKVLRLWQGLGYYSRARNLHRCAKIIVNEYNGFFPDTYESLLSLHGIGPYTAEAIASIAFKRKEAVVDGNVIRVISRFIGITGNVAETSTLKEINSIARKLVSQDYPGEYNQAIMDLGAMVCTPTNAKCDICPVNSNCYALKNKMQARLPLKIKKLKRRKRKG